MSAHTPGPWVFDPENDNTDEMGHAAGSVRDERDGWFIARVWKTGPNPQADARLIAAAPELLGALAVLMLEVEDSAHVLPQTIRKAQLAIAKATGEQA